MAYQNAQIMMFGGEQHIPTGTGVGIQQQVYNIYVSQ
jgi:hypothetical protein